MNFSPRLVIIWVAIAILWLSIVGFFLLVGLSAVVAALIEKRHVRNLLPLDKDGAPSPNDPGPHPYMDLANEMVGQLGYDFGGIFVQAKKGPSKWRVALWRSPKRDALVVISISVAGGPLHVESTSFISHIRRRYLITTDQVGEGDISGLLQYEVVLHGIQGAHLPGFRDEEIHQQAHFQKLLARHEERLAESKGKLILFQAKDMSEDLNTMRMERAQHMVQSGYAKFLDHEKTIWRYTPRGATRFFFRSYLKHFLPGR
jgi:hypothetical protein